MLRVATLPGRSLYARHLSHPEGIDGIHRTTVSMLGTAPRDGSFDVAWLLNHLDEIDIVHVLGLPPSTGPDSVDATRAAVDAVRRSGTPLVVTAYHLRDPAGHDDDTFGRRLAELLARADAVLTLTDSAAGEIARRWNLASTVLPHPHAVDFVRMRSPRPTRRRGLVVGTHLGSLRLPVDPVVFVDALTRAVAATPGAHLRVHVNESVTDAGATAYAPHAMRAIAALVQSVGGSLLVHRPLTEAKLWDHLSALDVSVVPGVHGSHSVWPEACADLGTQAVLPSSSHASRQRPATLDYTPGEDVEQVADSLAGALRAVGEADGVHRSDPAARWNERVTVCERHRSIYDALLGSA